MMEGKMNVLGIDQVCAKTKKESAGTAQDMSMYHHILYNRSFNRIYDLNCLQNINNWRFSPLMSSKAQINRPNNLRRVRLVVFLAILFGLQAHAQSDTIGFWDRPAKINKARFFTAAGAGAIGYAGTLFSLNELWYKQYPRTSFHFFNDAHEWQQMDKAGHMFTAYFEADWLYGITRWTGMQDDGAIWTSAAVATGLQATVEMLDGYSSKWGFSVYDFASNLAGSGLWAFQQSAWDEQRIRMKVSSTYKEYPDKIISGYPEGTTTLRKRTDDLYGENIFQSFLKDYNAQTVWLSVNPYSFMKKENKFPHWLNIAVGYSAENMYGGFENEWEVDGTTFTLSESEYPRYRQWYLSPDIDLSKIKTRSKPLHTLLSMLNIFKFPAPALEINGKGGVKVKWMHF